MNKEDFENAPNGVSKTKTSEIIFKVWAPHAKSVRLTGTFNNWDESSLKLEAIDNGHWAILVSDIKDGDAYKYVIETQDGTLLKRNDPHAKKVTNSIGNSVVYLEDFDWNGTDQFKLESHNQLVIYELHIGTFNKKEGQEVGDFYSAIEKLDYLVDLGINTIEVMPICEFSGDFSWGYNPAHPYAVESIYGGPEGFKIFVKEAHKRGLGVILDVVYNHFGPSDMDLWQFDGWSEQDKGGIYFYNDWKSKTPWGDTRPDYGRGEVRNYIFQNAMMWLEEYKCDGLRMDMIPYMRNVNADESAANNIEEGKTLIQWINKEIHSKYPNKILIAEDLHMINDITAKVENGGLGYSSQWCAAFVHPVREVITTVDDDSRDLLKIEHALTKKYNIDAFERIVYTESHDEVANGKARIVEEIAVDDVNNYFSKKRAQIAAALIFTAPGIPMIFQGQELLEDGYFDDGDPIDWKNLDTYKNYVHFFKDIIALRRNLEGNTKGLQSQHIAIQHLDNDSKILAFHRFDKGGSQDSVFVLINFANRYLENYQVEFPSEGNWTLRLNSDTTYYDPKNKNRDINLSMEGSKGHLNIAEYQILIFTLD
jgi:1,4-alpha-glucan branching enzyme